MPRNKPSPEPPVMTRREEVPVIAAAILLDAIRIFFEFFWFFGPALAAIYCTVKATNIVTTISIGLLGAKTAGVICSTIALAAGTAAIEVTAAISVVMSDASGLAAFLILGLWVVWTNKRIFKTAATAPLWFAGAFLLSELPFIGALPSFTFVLWRLYGAQIKAETAAHQKWEQENADRLQQEQNQQITRLAQMQQQEAANDAVYAQQDVANDEVYDPTEVADNEAFRQAQRDGVRLDTSLQPGIPALTAANDAQYTQKKAA